MLEIKGGLDAVIIATPCEWHKSMIVGSVEAGIKVMSYRSDARNYFTRSLGCGEGR